MSDTMKYLGKNIVIAVNGEGSKKKDICGALKCKRFVEKNLLKKGIKSDSLYLKKKDFRDIKKLRSKLAELKPYCVFNLFEGFSDDPGKEAEFVRILERAKIGFTGNPSVTLSNCLDKAKTKNILTKHNIPVAKGICTKSVHCVRLNNLSFPLFIKPRKEDASVGIHNDSLVHTKEELHRTLEKRFKFSAGELIVEEFLPGKEYNLAFLGNDNYEFLGLSELDYSKHKKLPPFLTYCAKWDTKTQVFRKLIPQHNVSIEEKDRRKLVRLAATAAKVLGCKGYFRVDLREKDGNMFVIDINPNPDINKDSGYMKQACKRGYTHGMLLEKIIQLA